MLDSRSSPFVNTIQLLLEPPKSAYEHLRSRPGRPETPERWRADIRDLVGLTETKMDNYLLANTIQLALVVALCAEPPKNLVQLVTNLARKVVIQHTTCSQL